LPIMIAFIFPGQASQFVGMGAELAGTYPVAAEVIGQADDTLGFGLSDLMFRGPSAELTATEVAQPALLTHSAATFRVLEDNGLNPDIVAGHSLGEYSALVAAGALDFAEALSLVRQRGLLMAEAGREVGGTMAAVIGSDAKRVEESVEQAVQEGHTVVVANYNCPGQIVISGTETGVGRVRQLAKEAGARGSIPIEVSGAFHSPLMEPVAAQFAEYLQVALITDAQVPVVCNVDAVAHTEAKSIKNALVQQLTNSVLWEKSIRTMMAGGVDTFVEVGPKDVLTKMMKRIAPEVRALATSEPADIDRVLQQFV